MKVIMSGNEAIARGAYEGGARFASAYPGTPSTEILENMPQYGDAVCSEWAPNEKVATEAAIGASIAGVRSFCDECWPGSSATTITKPPVTPV